MEKLNKIKELISQLNQYSYEYYSLGQPTISDNTYDKLYDELLQLEETTGIVLSNSPTQKVGNIILDKLQKVTHEYPLLSLDKTKDINTLRNFTKGKEGILMLKLDGLTIDNTYENGVLIQSETRGNGNEGELITENAKTFTNLPLSIPYKGRVHIIGEAIITYNVFEEINSKLTNDKKYKNPRNLSSGSVRQLDSNICKQRKVKFIGYIVEGLNLKTKVEQFEFMLQQGFDIADWLPFDTNEDNLKLDIETMKMLANKKQYPIDGLVMQYNDIEYGKSLGKTNHHYLHSIAFKFNEDVEISVLRNIEWQVGRTGQITPVAIFDGVELVGTTVSRASLHNISILKSLKLGVGDEIAIVKKNEIIPQVIDNLTKSNTMTIPTKCPVCEHNTIIKKDNDSEVLMCTNDNCKAKLVQKITHYCSRNALNIDGFSEATIEKFIELGFIKSIQDIYYLSSEKCKYKNEIIKLDGFGKKSFDNLVKAINQSKQCKLESFIFGLGIPNVGKSTAKNIVDYCKGDTSLDTINNIINTPPHVWTKMKDCGNVVANSIFKWFSDKNNLEVVGYLTQIELNFIEDKPKVTNQGIFTGKRIYATGKFLNYKKNELKEIIESHGGVFASGYTKSLSYLVVGSVKGSSKTEKAKVDNIPILTEDEFMQTIKGN